MKKSLLFIAALLTVISTNLFSEDIPDWYSDDINVIETEITRKNANGKWVPFIEKNYTACANVKISDTIYSLEMARDEAEKQANEKLDTYFKEIKEKDLLNSKHELYKYHYDDSLADGGAYVQVSVVSRKEKEEESKPAYALDYKKEIAETSSLSRILTYGFDRFTLVDTFTFFSEESLQSHHVSYVKTNASVDDTPVKTEEAYYYPDGVLVHDTKVELKNTLLQFTLRNIVKGRKTLIIIRTDVDTNNTELQIELEGKNTYSSKITKDTKNRWRNTIFEVEEGEITTYSPTFTIKELPHKQGFASIFVYQLL